MNSFIGNQPATSFESPKKDRFTGISGTTCSLTYAVSSVSDIIVWVNSVKQDFTNYSVSGSTLTLGGTLVSADIVEVTYVGRTYQSVNPNDASVGANQVQASIITGQTALGATPADTDELLISDAGTLKRVDYSYLKSSVVNRPNVNPLIINGDMSVSQRATTKTSASGYTTVDRFRNFQDDGVVTATQESLTSGNAYINGFANAFKLDVTTADSSVANNHLAGIQYRFEGQDLQVFKKGTANAEKFTVAFWIKSTKTGTYICELEDQDNSRNNSQSYTVSTTNTWEHKVVNFPADTTGVFGDDNAHSLNINWFLNAGTDYTSGSLQTAWGSETAANRCVGQVNALDNTSNNIHITGVQLEVGEYTSSTLPPFQHESYGDNLQRCQRYYFKNNTVSASMPFASGVVSGTTNSRAVIFYPQPMRSPPTLDKSSSTDFKVFCGSTNVDSTNVAFYYPNNYQALLYVDVSSGLTNGQGCVIIDDGGGNAFIEGNAEL